MVSFTKCVSRLLADVRPFALWARGTLLHCCPYVNKPVFEGLLGHLAGGPAHLFGNGVLLSLGNLVDLVSSVQAVGTPLSTQPRCVSATWKATLMGQTLWQNQKIIIFFFNLISGTIT